MAHLSIWPRLLVRTVSVSECWGQHSPKSHLKWLASLSINNLVDLHIRIARDFTIESFHFRILPTIFMVSGFECSWTFASLGLGSEPPFTGLCDIGNFKPVLFKWSWFGNQHLFILISYSIFFLLFESTQRMFCFTTWLDTTNLFRIKFWILLIVILLAKSQ